MTAWTADGKKEEEEVFKYARAAFISPFARRVFLFRLCHLQSHPLGKGKGGTVSRLCAVLHNYIH